MDQQQQQKGLRRNTIDKYYTNPKVVALCIERIKRHIEIDKERDIIIEPSAGNGAFIEDIKTLLNANNNNTLFYDIEPEHTDIIAQNYILLDTSAVVKDMCGVGRIHIIGNPPFGRQSSIAISFIKKSSAFCHTISFILPKSFKKDSLKKTFPLEFHLIYEMDLPENAFLVNGTEYNVPCIFQIWEKRAENRDRVEKLVPVHFQFVKQNENPDISFRRVGVNAGAISVGDIDKKSPQSHYFIRFTAGAVDIEKLRTITFEFNNTVGPKSISKQELIGKFNPLLCP